MRGIKKGPLTTADHAGDVHTYMRERKVGRLITQTTLTIGRVSVSLRLSAQR